MVHSKNDKSNSFHLWTKHNIKGYTYQLNPPESGDVLFLPLIQKLKMIKISLTVILSKDDIFFPVNLYSLKTHEF